MNRTTLKVLQHEIDLAYLPYRARMLYKHGYAYSTIASLLGVKIKQIREWCRDTWLPPKYRPRRQTYLKSPEHRRKRLDGYHRDTYLTKKRTLGRLIS